jgi:UDP:flavonoid glycosyltransferase YjiC (YdhE family)
MRILAACSPGGASRRDQGEPTDIVKTQIRAGGARSVNTTPAPAITRGIEDVLGDVAYRDRARAIAAKMAATPTVDEVRTRLTSRRR